MKQGTTLRLNLRMFSGDLVIQGSVAPNRRPALRADVAGTVLLLQSEFKLFHSLGIAGAVTVHTLVKGTRSRPCR